MLKSTCKFLKQAETIGRGWKAVICQMLPAPEEAGNGLADEAPAWWVRTQL